MYAYLTVKDFSVTVQDEEIQVDVNIVPFFFLQSINVAFSIYLHAIFAKQTHIE